VWRRARRRRARSPSCAEQIAAQQKQLDEQRKALDAAQAAIDSQQKLLDRLSAGQGAPAAVASQAVAGAVRTAGQNPAADVDTKGRAFSPLAFTSAARIFAPAVLWILYFLPSPPFF